MKVYMKHSTSPYQLNTYLQKLKENTIIVKEIMFGQLLHHPQISNLLEIVLSQMKLLIHFGLRLIIYTVPLLNSLIKTIVHTDPSQISSIN